jgi:type II secretory pathway pseudopilin PulG
MSKKLNKRNGVTLAELVTAVAVIVLLAGVLVPGLNRSRATAIRLACEANLTGLGQAITVYTNENDARFPRAGGPGATWSPYGVIFYWTGGWSGTEDEAFAIVRDAYTGEVVHPGEATITSSFYLLVKYSMVTPKQVVCKGDAGALEFKISYSRYGMFIDYDMSRAWDFGDGERLGRTGPQLPYPGEVVSYSYHMPYCQPDYIETFVITDMSPSASPVCADRNPYLDKNAPPPPSDPNGIRSYNSASHLSTGQNVLYKDGHVKFETSPTVGLAGDNIYTYRTSPGEDPSLGTGPAEDGDPAAFPLDFTDALLLGERNGRTR